MMEIVTVHYNTPDLLERLIRSSNAICEYPIRVIDGSDTESMQQATKAICDLFLNVTLEQHGWNIHHGRGLHHAVSTSAFSLVLCVDSEVQLLDGIFRIFKYKTPLEGFCCDVNNHGMNVPQGQGILYLHPELLMVNADWYKSQPHHFIHHGAPAIDLMRHTSNAEKTCIPEELKKFYIRGGRGTVNRFGYNF